MQLPCETGAIGETELEKLAWHADPQNGDRGKLVPESQLFVPITTHALHYGTSVFEGIKFYDCGEDVRILCLREHVERLFLSAETIGMKLTEHYELEDIETACKQVVAANAKQGLREGYIRPLVYCSGGVGLGAGIGKFAAAIVVMGWKKSPDMPKDGVWVFFSSFIRPHPRSARMQAKCGGYYVNNILAVMEGLARGGPDPILEDYQGYLGEASSCNLFIVKDGKLLTPGSDSILKGITRKCVMEMAKVLDLPVEVKPLKRQDLLAADEAFLCGTASEILPIGTVGSTKIAGGKIGPLTRRLWQTFVDAIHGRDVRFAHWLTPVPPA